MKFARYTGDPKLGRKESILFTFTLGEKLKLLEYGEKFILERDPDGTLSLRVSDIGYRFGSQIKTVRTGDHDQRLAMPDHHIRDVICRIPEMGLTQIHTYQFGSEGIEFLLPENPRRKMMRAPKIPGEKREILSEKSPLERAAMVFERELRRVQEESDDEFEVSFRDGKLLVNRLVRRTEKVYG